VGLARAVAGWTVRIRAGGDRRFPELIDYEVQIGRLRGVPAAQVPAELGVLQTRARKAVAGPDGAISVGIPPATPLELRSVLLLAANLHGEWVRIHPFANGNGRPTKG